jgi:hypothetical protein
LFCAKRRWVPVIVATLAPVRVPTNRRRDILIKSSRKR